MLEEQLVQEIKDLQKKKLSNGTLLPVAELQENYRTFQDRFGIERLQAIDGKELLSTMHDLNPNNRDSLVYWLEYKDDDDFRGRAFGLIGGANAMKYGIYQEKGTGIWKTRGQSNKSVEITVDEAIEIARKHREQLARGVELLRALPNDTSDDVYARLQNDLNREAPDVSDTMWGHKYFSLMFPDKLDDYHVANLQRFNLVKLLQPNIPSQDAGRYITAGRYVAIAQQLGMPINHLTGVLNTREEKFHRYWSVRVEDWPPQREGNFIGMDWNDLGDLSHVTYNRDSKQQLADRMQEHYPSSTKKDLQHLFYFLTLVNPNDIVVAFQASGRKVLGIGRITGDYYYYSDNLAHRRPVTWLTTEDSSWQFPHEEGFSDTLRSIERYENQVEIERRLLDVPRLDQDTRVTAQSTRISQGEPIRLSGIAGRIQIVLERKGQVILYGPPGTGKTYWAEKAACELVARQVYGKAFDQLEDEQRQRVFGGSESYVQLSSFHPAYGYEDFLEGYRPHLVNDQMTFMRQNGIFKRLCDRARNDGSRSYYLIIDEINRGDIPRIFGELLTVLEKDKRGKAIILPLSGESFTVPQNLFVIGTMNTADRSIALLDTALRRRFGFIELLPDPSQLGSAIVEGIPLGVWLEELNKRILQYVGRDARNLQVGHAYLLDKGRPITEFSKLARVIREDIIPLLEEYCYEDYGALKQILGQTLVDDKNQVIRHDLFETGREFDLAQALLEPTPDLTTLASVTEAETDDDEMIEDDDNSDDESQA